MACIDTTPCACGRGLPLLKEIQGRTTDFVVAADGTVMHGLALIYVVRDLPGVESFKIVQETAQRTRVQLVVNDGFDRNRRCADHCRIPAAIGAGRRRQRRVRRANCAREIRQVPLRDQPRRRGALRSTMRDLLIVLLVFAGCARRCAVPGSA